MFVPRADRHWFIESRLRSRLEMAEQRWRRRLVGHKTQLEVYRDVDPLNPDGHPLMTLPSMPHYNEALHEYSQALNEWTAFILEGKVPDWIDQS